MEAQVIDGRFALVIPRVRQGNVVEIIPPRVVEIPAEAPLVGSVMPVDGTVVQPGVVKAIEVAVERGETSNDAGSAI